MRSDFFFIKYCTCTNYCINSTSTWYKINGCSKMRDVTNSCDPGRLSDGSRLAVYQTLSIECPSSIFFWHVVCVIVPFVFKEKVLLFPPFCRVFVLFLFSCSRWSFVDVPLIFSRSADHVPDWQPRTWYILLGMVEALSVNVKNTYTDRHTVFTHY